MKRKLKTLGTSIMLAIAFLSFVVQPTLVAATENGGAVPTQGAISFYEGKTTPSSSEPTQTSSEVTKPTGKLPSTGELIKKSLSISGLAVILIAVFFFFWKRKKGKAEEGNRI